MLKSIIPALGLLMLAGAVQAHVTLEQKEAAIGTTTKITVRVPHGCKGEATRTVRVQLPDGFYAAKPMPKAGWRLETVTGAYDAPYDNHGEIMSEGVREIVWSDGNLQDDWYDEFTFRGSLGKDMVPGTVLYFPTVQECENGTADWSDTSGASGVPNPAPKLTLVAGAGDHHDHAMMMQGGGTVAASYVLGNLTLSDAFARATLPNAPVGGGFLTVTNNGTDDDRLVSATSDVAGRVEIHEMAMKGDVMKMRPLPDGLPIPAGETVALKPGGFHIMLMDLKQPLVEGQTVNVTLVFEKAGKVMIPLAIGAPNAKGQGGMQHDGMKMDHGALQLLPGQTRTGSPRVPA